MTDAVTLMRFHGPGWELERGDMKYQLWAPQDGEIIDPNAHLLTSSAAPRDRWAASRHQHLGEDATEEEELYADSAFTRGDTAEDVLRIFPPDVRQMFERSIAEAARR